MSYYAIQFATVVSKHVPVRIVNAISCLPCWRCTKDSNTVRLCLYVPHQSMLCFRKRSISAVYSLYT